MNRLLPALGPLLGRLLLAAPLLYSGYVKVVAPGRTASTLAGHGVPFATLGAYAAAAFEIAVGALVAIGLKARSASLATVFYLLVVTWLAHWHPALRGDRAQLVHLLKNAAMAGGFLLLAANGPGPASVDRG